MKINKRLIGIIMIITSTAYMVFINSDIVASWVVFFIIGITFIATSKKK